MHLLPIYQWCVFHYLLMLGLLLSAQLQSHISLSLLLIHFVLQYIVFALHKRYRLIDVKFFLAEFNFLAAASAAAFFSASTFLAASIWACVGFGVAAIAEVGIKDKINASAITFLLISLPHPFS